MKIEYLISLALLALIVVGCKPTEKNYKNAYDVALAKKQAAAESLDVDASDLQSVEGIRRQQVEGSSVSILSETVKPLESEQLGGEGAMAVVVGKFNMLTNARRQASDLASSDPDAIVCTNGKGLYFVSIKRCASLQEAAEIVEDFKSRHPDYPFVGLDGDPVVVHIR